MDIDLAITGGTVLDGTGAPGHRADVGVARGRIAAITPPGAAPPTEAVLDATGLVVAPGFIDHHQHGDVTPLVDGRCISSLAQGVTTIILGNCGHGVAPGLASDLSAAALIGYRAEWGLDLAFPTFGAYLDALDAARPTIGIGAYAAHGAIRLAVVGPESRGATERELGRMEALVEEAMAAGALGLSSGLEYSPGEYADTEELTRLARVVGRHGGAYATHIRNRMERFAEAVAEAIRIAEEAGTRLVLSHLAARPGTPADVLPRVEALLAAARGRGLPIVIDTFPDPFGPGGLAPMLPHEIVEGAADVVLARLADPAVRARVRGAFDRRDNFLLRAAGAETMRVVASGAHPEVLGRSLGEIAAAWSTDPADAACTLLLDEGADFPNVIISHAFATPDELERLYRDPWCAFESDGIVACPDGPLATMTMNRSSYGYTARVLQELVRERGLLSLEDAVRRLSALPADAVGLVDRGRIVPGARADLVLFDAATIEDRTSDLRLAEHPAGIAAVLVGGRVAWRDGRATGERPGEVIRGVPGWDPAG